MSCPEYIQHVYPTETFTEAFERLYEEAFIKKTILVCLNDTAVADYCMSLSALNHTVIPMTTPNALNVFKDTPNSVFILTLNQMKRLNSLAVSWMDAGWNTFASVDVPSYHLDELLSAIRLNHAKHPPTESVFHLLWFLH
jgi:hypothetical protein